VDCTLNGQSQIPFCGTGTLLSTGFVQAHGDCNSDPYLDVAVYSGSATLKLKANPSTPYTVAANQAVNVKAGKVTYSAAQFTKDQVALFDVQADSLRGGVSFYDANSFLQVPSLSQSHAVIAPNQLQARLGKQYGLLTQMCAEVNLPAVFYPADPLSDLPVLYGGSCSLERTLVVLGVAIYLPKSLGLFGPYFQTVQGGGLVKHQPFQVSVQPGSAARLFAWNGFSDAAAGVAGSATPSQAQRGTYVAKFVYQLPPDRTLRIGLVAFSAHGAGYPGIG
jgi:hypothetical protein